MLDKLAPCPFCGSEHVSMSFFATPDSGSTPAGHFIECETCSAAGEGVRIVGEAPDRIEYAQSKAIAAWNRRHPANGQSEGGGERLRTFAEFVLGQMHNLPRTQTANYVAHRCEEELAALHPQGASNA
ncbi:Lar family restriction alleviation protein [Brevundimonas sp.]